MHGKLRFLEAITKKQKQILKLLGATEIINS
jgi:hypothetical protein